MLHVNTGTMSSRSLINTFKMVSKHLNISSIIKRIFAYEARLLFSVHPSDYRQTFEGHVALMSPELTKMSTPIAINNKQ